MRPGSAELIEHYRQLAERGEPLIPDPDDPIPLRPGEDGAMQRIAAMEQQREHERKTVELHDAIDYLLSDEGQAYVEDRIATLESELDRLRRVRLAKPQPERAASRPSGGSTNGQITATDVIEWIDQFGPQKAGEIASAMDTTPQKIGRIVAATPELTRTHGKVTRA